MRIAAAHFVDQLCDGVGHDPAHQENASHTDQKCDKHINDNGSGNEL